MNGSQNNGSQNTPNQQPQNTNTFVTPIWNLAVPLFPEGEKAQQLYYKKLSKKNAEKGINGNMTAS